MKSIFSELGLMCQNMIVENLTRVLEEKSILVPSTSIFKELEEKNYYKASISLLSIMNRKNEEKEKLQGFFGIKTCAE